MWKEFYLALLAGSCLDLLLGDPEWLYHPVRLIGRYIRWCEAKLRARGGNLRALAPILTFSTVLLTAGICLLLISLATLWGRIPRLLVMSLLDWMGLCARDLAKEALRVCRALDEGVEAGRRQVARIVGRDTDQLDEAEILGATIETVAENTTDGIISPMLYALLGGPVLMWAFKAASTLDSMVGYLDPKYRDIGWSSARLDDVLNFLPARLCGLLLCLSAFLVRTDGGEAFRIMCRDHANHKSPNCAWSEAAAAGALHLRLGGTHLYFGKPVEKPTIGDGDHEPAVRDVRRVVIMMFTASALMLLFSGMILWAGGAFH